MNKPDERGTPAQGIAYSIWGQYTSNDKICFLLVIATILLIEGIYFLAFTPSWAYGNVEGRAKNVFLISGILYCMIFYFVRKR